MPKTKVYEPEFKKKIVQLYLEEGRTIKSLNEEYQLGDGTVRKWVRAFREECETNPDLNDTKNLYEENRKLRRELEEKKKEIAFLKKSRRILRKGNRLEQYQFIDGHKQEYGVRWLLRQMGICPNAYYNYKKNRKAGYREQKEKFKNKILQIYHEYSGNPGYRMMRVYLLRAKMSLSNTTVLKYMQELGIRPTVTPKKPAYKKGDCYKKFENHLNRKFHAEKPNEKWCTDVTYIFMEDGRKRYNCSIIDLFDRSVVATPNSSHIDAEPAVQTLKAALERNYHPKNLMLHSDQGSQYTSRAFTDYCKEEGIGQSMSKAGCPYDNSPMESFYGTFKAEFISKHRFSTDEEPNNATMDYVYAYYNHIRPHSSNGYMTPFEKRMQA